MIKALELFEDNLSNVFVQQVNDEAIKQYGVRLSVLRLDLLHQYISGNKWFKLKYNLEEAYRKGYNILLSFGGAYSNHIVALAYAGKLFGMKTIGVIRGEEYTPLNPALNFAKNCGMELYYVDRQTYRNKANVDFIERLRIRFGNFYLIPEGGANALGVKGCTEITKFIPSDVDVVMQACGTGNTLAGIINGLKKHQHAIGIPVLKGAKSFLEANIQSWLTASGKEKRWELIDNYHFGGYAKKNDLLVKFISNFYNNTKMPLEPIYTGKVFYAAYQLIKSGYFSPQTHILVIHSGGCSLIL